MKNRVFKIFLLVFVLLFAFGSLIQAADDVRGSKKVSSVYKTSSTLEGGAKGDAYAMNINNIYLPYNRKGIIADVNIPPYGSLGKYPNANGTGFLFSSGFFLSGYKNGQLWANAVASASLVEDYLQGTVATGASDSRAQIYVVRSDDPPFGDVWQVWKDAVDLGADFYDGDGDGVYNPVDLNGNGQWDPDEDRPDLIGDETGWTVYNDAIPKSQRRWNTVDPIGIEVKQTIFGFASAGAIGNILFIRYRFKYVGLSASDPEVLNDVYFGVWADPDLGDHNDDLVGVDVGRNAGYVYNNPARPDAQWGANPPVFMIDFFSGPVDYIPGVSFEDVDGDGVYTDGIDVALDTAYSVQGQIKGVVEYPGATNLGISSFVHYQQSDPQLGDPRNAVEARNYMLGLTSSGDEVDPCDWSLGQVLGGVNCATIDGKLWYSGDPVTRTGWINTNPTDQRQMQNTGPFELRKGEEKEIMVAYVVGQGSDALSSLTETRRIDDGAQFVFDNNFLSPAPPPAASVTVETNDEFIDLIWETANQVGYENLTDAYDLYFEGYNVWSFRTRTTQDVIANRPNKQLYRRYTVDNDIVDVYKENPNTGGIELLYSEGSVLLDATTYKDQQLGKIRMRITEDPWGGPLVKGKPYYFAVTSYAINYKALVNKSTGVPGISGRGDYYLMSNAFVGEVENLPRIIEAVVGENIYRPPLDVQLADQSSGRASGAVNVDIIDKDVLTGNEYEVTFKIDSSRTNLYLPYWSLRNSTSGAILADSQQYYLSGDERIAYDSYDGFIIKVDSSLPAMGSIQAETAGSWINSSLTTAHYVSGDVASPPLISLNGITGSGNFLRADKLRNVEIRFGTPGKAYRYVSGFIGTAISKRANYYYAPAISANDTVGVGNLGKFGEGFIDVPFTAWVKDDNYGEERQLAVGIIEKAKGLGGNPDGNWDPGTNVTQTGEYIIVFNTDYDPNGNQLIYTGGFNDNPWANLRGYNIPVTEPISSEDRKKAASALFDALYVIGVSKNNANDTFTNGDKLIVPVENYPYTPTTTFTFKTNAQGALSSAQEKELFDKVNVFPNPLFGYNPATSWTGNVNNPDEPFVTFSNLPEDISIKIYSLSGQLLRSLNTDDKDSPTSPYLRWDLLNEDGLRVASGLYLAIVSSPKYGDKVLKFSIIMPQKQIQKY